MFRFSLQHLSKTFLILRIIEGDIIINAHRPSCKVLAILVRLLKREFSRPTLENFQISNIMKIRLVGAVFCHSDRRTDGQTVMTKLIIVFRNFFGQAYIVSVNRGNYKPVYNEHLQHEPKDP